MLAVILETARVHSPDFYPVVLLLARTGLRLGEVLALQVGDVDFDWPARVEDATWKGAIHG
jgi:integrase